MTDGIVGIGVAPEGGQEPDIVIDIEPVEVVEVIEVDLPADEGSSGGAARTRAPRKPAEQSDKPSVVHNKAEVVAAIAEGADLTKADAERWLTAFNDFMIEALSRGEMIKLTGLFEVMRVKRAARTGRNLQTGAEIEIPESWGVRFKPGSLLKNVVKY